MQHAELVLDCANHHGEGVFWSPGDGRVWWTDIHGQKLWSFDPVIRDARFFDVPGRVCCFAPRARGGFIVAFSDRISLYSFERGEEACLCVFEPDNPDTRLNDGRTDRQGCFIVGGMNEKTGTANSSLLRVDADHKVTVLFRAVSCANSICFSPDGQTMYFADTPDREIRAYDYNPETGAIANGRVHASFANEPGLPDGSCVDAEGGVWNAEWEGRRVVRVAPDGTIDRIIEVPVWKPTCCAFGGPDLDTLFITTSRLMGSDQQLAAEPQSGGLFAVKPGFKGVPDAPFAG